MIFKYVGGVVLDDGECLFYIYYNYFMISYVIEFLWNNVEIDYNFFDFDLEEDGGNFISGFGGVDVLGLVSFYNNLVSNFGCGVIWI